MPGGHAFGGLDYLHQNEIMVRGRRIRVRPDGDEKEVVVLLTEYCSG